MERLTGIKPTLGCSGKAEGQTERVLLLLWKKVRHLEGYLPDHLANDRDIQFSFGEFIQPGLGFSALPSLAFLQWQSDALVVNKLSGLSVF